MRIVAGSTSLVSIYGHRVGLCFAKWDRYFTFRDSIGWASAASSACHGAFSARNMPISAIIFGAVVLQDQVSRNRAILDAFRQYS